MTDRERLAKLVEEVRQLRAMMEKATKDGADAALVERLNTKAQSKMVELADTQAKLLDDDA